MKIDKKILALFKEIVNILKEYMEDYHLAMFTHVMDLFQEHASLKKPILEHFFHKFIARFDDEGIGFPWQPIINRIYET